MLVHSAVYGRHSQNTYRIYGLNMKTQAEWYYYVSVKCSTCADFPSCCGIVLCMVRQNRWTKSCCCIQTKRLTLNSHSECLRWVKYNVFNVFNVFFFNLLGTSTWHMIWWYCNFWCGFWYISYEFIYLCGMSDFSLSKIFNTHWKKVGGFVVWSNKKMVEIQMRKTVDFVWALDCSSLR